MIEITTTGKYTVNKQSEVYHARDVFVVTVIDVTVFGVLLCNVCVHVAHYNRDCEKVKESIIIK